MKTIIYTAVSAIAAVLLSTSAVAGTAPHRMPTDVATAQPAYELKLDGAARTDRPLIVSLVDRATGATVANGEVAMLRPVYRSLKGQPNVQWVAETLPRSADGNFVCASEHHATGVTLRGEGPSGEAPVWLDVPVHS
jgi:hypothetical protein